MKLTLVIPIYNEEAVIGRCLQNLSQLPANVEILFADGGSTDRTVELIGNRYPVIRCPKGRARQMNYAAKSATGDILWFCHCDSLLPPEGPAQIEKAVARGAQFGCFHIGFDYNGPFMRCNAFNSNLRVRLWHIAFGDQGIFVTRELFLRQSGFPELPIMEDYEFSRRMKKRGIPLYFLPGRIITSGRRYRGQFPLITMAQMIYLRHLYRTGTDINEIARRYRDIR